MTQIIRCLSLALCLALCLALGGCASRDSFSFVEYSRNPRKYDAPGTPRDWDANDQQALQFSSNVARLLRARASGARVTREISNSAQVAMAGLSGAGTAFNLSKSSLAVLGLGSALIPDLQGIFNAKGRAEAYTDAVRLIETAQNDYMAHNQSPSPTELTQNGVTLIQRTQASIHIVEKVFSGRVPTIIDLQQATEPMSGFGATHTEPGVAVNHINAQGQPSITQEQLARIERAQGVSLTKRTETKETTIVQGRSQGESELSKEVNAFKKRVDKLDDRIPREKRDEEWLAALKAAGISPSDKGLEAAASASPRVKFKEAYRVFPSKRLDLTQQVEVLEAKFPITQAMKDAESTKGTGATGGNTNTNQAAADKAEQARVDAEFKRDQERPKPAVTPPPPKPATPPGRRTF